MFTYFFARRYEKPRMWETFCEEPRRLLVQGYQLLNDVCPYYLDGKESEHGKDFWRRIHDLVARELGLKELSPEGWGFYNQQNLWQGGRHTTVQMCETWMLEPFDGKISADRFIKERLSLVEIGFRQHENFVAGRKAKPPGKTTAGEFFAQRGETTGHLGTRKPADPGPRPNHPSNEKFQ